MSLPGKDSGHGPQAGDPGQAAGGELPGQGRAVLRRTEQTYRLQIALVGPQGGEDLFPGQGLDQGIAEKTGALLARTHNIAEECDIHVTNDVIFDPFKHNDLLFYTDFAEIISKLEENVRILADRRRFQSVLTPSSL